MLWLVHFLSLVIVIQSWKFCIPAAFVNFGESFKCESDSISHSLWSRPEIAPTFFGEGIRGVYTISPDSSRGPFDVYCDRKKLYNVGGSQQKSRQELATVNSIFLHMILRMGGTLGWWGRPERIYSVFLPRPWFIWLALFTDVPWKGLWRGQGRWTKTEQNGSKSAQEIHARQMTNHLSELNLSLFKTSSDLLKVESATVHFHANPYISPIA